MSVGLRDLATGVASCVLLLPAGCRRTPATVVDPQTGGGGGDSAAEVPATDTCEAPARKPVDAVAAPTLGDGEPPYVAGGRFVTRDRVQLSFNEPLEPPTQVNPRQFRLSMAYSMLDYGAGYASGYYYDVAGADNYEPPVVVTSLETYEGRPEVLALQLSRPVPVELCVDIQDMHAERADSAGADGPGQRVRMGLFLHYTNRGSVGVRDVAGTPLGDMGGAWALHFGSRHQSMYGTEPVMRLDLLIELACPEEALGVSAPPGPN